MLLFPVLDHNFDHIFAALVLAESHTTPAQGTAPHLRLFPHSSNVTAFMHILLPHTRAHTHGYYVQLTGDSSSIEPY